MQNFTADLFYEVTVKSTVEISQNFVAFSENMNFTVSKYAAVIKNFKYVFDLNISR